MFIYAWRDVDPQDTELTPREANALRGMLKKMGQYLHEGRTADAHGMGTGIMIAFHCLKGFDPYEGSEEETVTTQAPL